MYIFQKKIQKDPTNQDLCIYHVTSAKPNITPLSAKGAVQTGVLPYCKLV